MSSSAQQRLPVEQVVVTPDYFDTMKVPLLEGRRFSLQDTRGGTPVAIVDEGLARSCVPNGEIIGKHILLGPSGARSGAAIIVGVVGDVMSEFRHGLAVPHVYLPESQAISRSMSIVVRSRVSPGELIEPLEQAAWSVDRDIPLGEFVIVDQAVKELLAPQYSVVIIVGSLSILAVILASVGVFAVMSYNVAQRKREMGIRMAIGAGQGDVMMLLLMQGGQLVGMGLVLGLVVAIALVRMIASELGEIATDPLSYIGTLMLLAVVGFLAIYIPARRATAINPVETLRCE